MRDTYPNAAILLVRATYHTLTWRFFFFSYYQCLRLLPTFRGRENRFFLYLTKLNSNIQPNVSTKKKKKLKFLKVPELFRKTYFKIKVNKSGRCHNLRPERIPESKGPKKNERVPFCQEKRKNSLLKRLILVELHAGVQISNKELAVKSKLLNMLR